MAGRCIDVLRASTHGDLPGWLAVLSRLPSAGRVGVSCGSTVRAGCAGDLDVSRREELSAALLGLVPWRKGPFRLFGILIDAEWRCDLKWARIAPHVDLRDRRVLDVGCGNGYYGWRMLEAGAKSVTGIDPSLLSVLQHAAVAYYAGGLPNLVLPLRIEDLEPAEPYDVVLSMGVVYHRRDPAGHVRDLVRHAHRDAVLVMESLVVDAGPLRPRDRYARMRNVYVVPDVAMLRSWLADAGFANSRVVDVTATTAAEQRPTSWMPYESLTHALDPADPTRTVEGYPAPKRAVIIAAR